MPTPESIQHFFNMKVGIGSRLQNLLDIFELLIVIKRNTAKHEKYIKWPSSHALFILPHTTLLWAM